MTLNVDLLHFLIGDLAPGWIFSAVQPAGHFQSFRRGGLGDEVDNRFVIAQRLSTPIRREKGKEPVFDLVPLARAWRKMADGQATICVIRKLLQFQLPQPQPPAITAPAVGCDQDACGLRIQPLAGTRTVRITERKTRTEWARFLETIAEHYRQARTITLVMDNLNTHSPGSLYETFAPQAAKALWERFEFVYTPKHGSWLNMAEIELNVLIKQCLDRRIDTREEMQAEVAAWQRRRNNRNSSINWQFTMPDARIKLKRLYPTL